MSDVDRLRAWFESDRLLRPDPALPNTVDLARALAAVAGVTRFNGDRGARRILSSIGRSGRTVFVVVDGLGMNVVERLPVDSFCRRNLKLELRSVFPSSTAPALTSLATGLWPAQHSVASWFVYLRRDGLTATILPYVERFGGRDLGESGVPMSRAFPAAELRSEFLSETVLVLPRRIADSVYTRYIAGGSARIPYSSSASGCASVRDLVCGRTSSIFVHLYVPDVDMAAHARGAGSRQTLEVAARVDAEIADLAAAVAGRARIVVTADHGGIDPGRSGRATLAKDDPLMEMLLAPPSGEPRAPIFHLRSRRDLGRFPFEFRRRFGERWVILSTEEVESLELLGPGPLASRTRDRLGDFMAIAGGDEVLLYGPEQAIATMRGFHGGLTPAEVRVPLIVA